MIGQQKRPLDRTVSSQPVKYQKHFGDNLSEGNTRVASLTDEQLEFQQHFSGVSQKTTFSVSPGANCDSLNLDERQLLLETPAANSDRVYPQIENGVHLNPHETAGLSKASVVANPAHEVCAKESKIKDHEGKRCPLTSWKESQQTSQSMELYLEKDRDDPSLTGLDVSIDEDNRNTSHVLGNASRDRSLPCPGDVQVGLHQGVLSSTTPSTVDGNVEGILIPKTIEEAGEARVPNGSQPLPVIANEDIDFAAMHELVTSLGGYRTVTSDGLWGNICESLGLEPDFGPGLKLIHFNYLRGLEKERGFLPGGQLETMLPDSVNTSITGLCKEQSLADEDVESYSLAVGYRFTESDRFHEKRGNNRVDDGSLYRKMEHSQELDHLEDENERVTVKRDWILEKAQVKPKADQDSGHKQLQGSSIFLGTCSFSHECQDIPGPDHLDSRLVKGLSGHVGTGVWKQGQPPEKSIEQVVNYEATLERDCKALLNTLIWMKRIALEPGNPDMGQGPDGTNQTEEWVRECASRARKIRMLLWKRRHEIRPGDAHLHQVKQIPAPSMYYDLPRPELQSLDRLRATRERVAHYGIPSASRPLHESGSTSYSAHSNWVGEASHRLPRQSHFYSEERYQEDSFPDRPRKRIPIGSDFQAHIPLWRCADYASSIAGNTRAGPTGDDTQSSDEDEEDNGRWLGKQVWPAPGCKRGAYKDQLVQRRDFCFCLYPDSLDCVRQHIIEERDLLKRELGQAFYTWKFDEMGECVADCWTKEEEQTFRTLVKMNPPSRDKNFWDQLPEAFPNKKMRELVSYYFNVFVFRRRAIQNRMDPKHVDSDDDETQLPDGDSEDSENYESEEDVDDEADEDVSEYKDEDKLDNQESLYRSKCATKLLEEKDCDDLGGANLVHSRKVSTEDGGVPVTFCSTSVIGLEDAQQAYHDPCLEQRALGLHSTSMTAEWKHDKKLLGEECVSISGEKEFQEVKSWEVSHWDEANHDPARVMSNKVETLTLPADPNPSPYDDDDMNSSNKHVSLGHCEGQVWGPTMDFSPRKERDKLLSTNGMIQEFFGDELPGPNSSN